MPTRLMLVLAHPDDETSMAGGTICRVIDEGGDVLVVTATSGELGTLGTGGTQVTREELPALREAELRGVLVSYGVRREPIFLGYRDQELASAGIGPVADAVLAIMREFEPSVVMTFGPLGISRHTDHIAIHQAAAEAFHRYAVSPSGTSAVRLLYAAVPPDLSDFEFDLDGPEAAPNVWVDVADYWRLKTAGLRAYKSQEDAQGFASYLESVFFVCETFHQAHPALGEGVILLGL